MKEGNDNLYLGDAQSLVREIANENIITVKIKYICYYKCSNRRNFKKEV